MNWILKNKNSACENSQSREFAFGKISSQDKKKNYRRAKTLFAVLFLVCVLSAIAPAAHAADTLSDWAQCMIDNKGSCTACKGLAGENTSYCPTTSAASSTANASAIKTPSADDIDTGSWVGDAFVEGISYILTGVQAVVGKLFAISATLFSVVVAPENISGTTGILNKTAIRDVWIMVRDTLNMTFILILLFSAFCTIFQVDKWNLKKVWLNILINALLVNFSFPIARFFIDISNVAMYYFINNLFASTGTVTGSTIFSSFGSSSGISQILAPGDFASNPIAFQIAMIVFTFIFGMTLLIIAVLFLIRLIALAILIMFAPIGFVGYIFPATSGYADKWWSSLFSYSFFGPIMVFMMAVALKIAQSINTENMSSFTAHANINSSSDQSSWIASAAFYFIPVIILWAGMGVAKSMGVAGADTVVSSVKKGGKWVAKTFSGANYLKKNYDAFSASRKKRAEELNKKRWGGNLGDKTNDIQDKAMAAVTGGKDSKAGKRYNKRKDTANKEDIKKKSEDYDGTTEAVLHGDIAGMNKAALGAMDDNAVKDAAGKVKQALSRGSTYEKHVENTLKGHAAGHVGLSGTAKPADVRKAVITKRMTAADIAMERDREKQEKDAHDKWLQEEKVAHMNQARAVIKEAEDRGKLK